MEHRQVLVVVIPLLAAPLCALLPGRRLPWAFATAVAWTVLWASAVLALEVRAVGLLSYELGGWAAPRGIEYRLDASSALPAGVIPKLYCPDNNVTRAEMAVFVERALGNFSPNPSPTDIFADVPTDHWAARFIDQFFNDGITQGCAVGPLRYCPNKT